MASNTLKTASVLAFERKLDPSDALFYSCNWDERQETSRCAPITVREKSVRGTISNRLKASGQDPAKLDAAIQNPNLQTVDVATLPPGADTVRASFTLRVLGGAGTPSACNNADYQSKLKSVVDQYAVEAGFGELAERYAYNLANGRFLWRNRIGAEAVEVHVRQLQEGGVLKEWAFDAMSFPLRYFQAGGNPDLIELGQVIEKGLAGKSYTLLEVVAYARMGAGQEVFPSQELILDRGSARGQKSKTLYTVDDIAAMHSQKVGNALRTIDTWYEDEEGLGPIAVEPYGSVTSQGKAYRQPKQKKDFYSLLDNWLLKDQAPELEQQHFVMAILIRGGVFGASEKD